jgi:hypothetical protein
MRRLARASPRWYLDLMALVGLVRVTTVARALHCDRKTARAWLGRIGYEVIRAPTAWRSARGSSPAYVTLEGAYALTDALFPRLVDRKARARAREQLREQARRLEDSTRRIEHVPVGGTGAETPWLKSPL